MPITIDDTTRCAGCMAETAEASRCPHCGYEPGGDRNLHALEEGTTLDARFVIGRILGKPGGYGITYLAWDKTLNTTVAIKEYLPQRLAARKSGETAIVPNSADDASVFEEGLHAFVDEARLLIRFTHPNIARVRDFFQQNGTAYMVMDYYEGRSLGEHMVKKRRPLSVDEAIGLLLPILDGLEEVHGLGYIHRDIKPTNIYITAGGWPILLDFGAARYALGDQTESLTVMLTPGFAPVEQYLSRGKQGPWTDVYSCAATLYYLLSGRKPQSAIDRQDLDELVDLHTANPNVSKGLSKVIMKALNVQQTERHQSTAAFRQALAQFASKRARIRTQLISTGKWVGVVIGLGLLALVALALYQNLFHSGSEPPARTITLKPGSKPTIEEARRSPDRRVIGPSGAETVRHELALPPAGASD